HRFALAKVAFFGPRATDRYPAATKGLEAQAPAQGSFMAPDRGPAAHFGPFRGRIVWLALRISFFIEKACGAWCESSAHPGCTHEHDRAHFGCSLPALFAQDSGTSFPRASACTGS